MRITDELRKWLDHAYTFSKDEAIVRIPYPWFGWKPNLERMLDRIDAEYKAAVDKAHADGERNGLQQARSASEDWQRGFDEGFASADDWLAEHEDAYACQWTRTACRYAWGTDCDPRARRATRCSRLQRLSGTGADG